MTHMPPQELLEATHAFPGKYVFKAIGVNESDFSERVVALVRNELQHDFDPPFEVKLTPHGRHIAVTIEPWVETAAQVLAIYQRLRTAEGLMLLL